MKILFISLVLLTLVGCANVNSGWHLPALYYDNNKALVEHTRLQYLADQNSQYQNYPHLYPYPYTILDW